MVNSHKYFIVGILGLSFVCQGFIQPNKAMGQTPDPKAQEAPAPFLEALEKAAATENVNDGADKSTPPNRSSQPKSKANTKRNVTSPNVRTSPARNPRPPRRNTTRRTQPEQNGSSSTSHDILMADDNGHRLEILDLKNMDILDVLKLISKQSGMNIVAGKNVRGRVTVYLKDIEVEEALNIIVDANDWAYVKEPDIIKIMAASEFETRYGYKFGLESETKIVTLSFARATDLLTLLTQIKSPDGKIIAEDNSQILVLIDRPEKIIRMEEIIAQVDVPVNTEIFELNYANAEDLLTQISEELTPNLGSIKSDKRSNKIIVTDTEKKLDKITEMIEAFDQKDQEVLIEAKILQIVLSDQFKMGVNWEAVVRDYHNLNLTSNLDIFADNAKAGQLKVGTIANDDYTALVEALSTVGATEILSSPRVTAVNNTEAKILVGSTEPYVTTTTTTPASGPTTTAESINFIEVGVKLYVTPTIHRDDFITMNIKPEVSSVTSTIVTGNNNTIPVVETAEAETTVIVKDGITIVIGGLIKEENILMTNEIPLFGKIPVLGMFFRNTDDKVENTEIVIFLTPRIVTGDEDFQG